MKLKVCGLNEPTNMQEVVSLSPDWIGMIFYEKSKRFAGSFPSAFAREQEVNRVGVFVNSSVDFIRKTAREYQLDFIQLHGDEQFGFVKELDDLGYNIIKVFRVSDHLPKDQLSLFEPHVELFLFDTLADEYGGTGQKFDWSILKSYDLDTPYLLSGGIDYDDIQEIKSTKLPGLIGIDVNSKFEIEPGLKDIEKLRKLKEVV